MERVKEFFVTKEQLAETSRSLQGFGARGCEGFVLWLGKIEEDNCTVESVLTPPQNSIQSEEGVGYFITNDTLLSLNKQLSATGLRLLAQVHSHPQEAYHSPMDDRYCIVTQEGGFSVVVPYFGFKAIDLCKWAIYRLRNGSWHRLNDRDIACTFPGHEVSERQTDEGFLKKLFKMLS